ncbi:MAG: proline dehydrogenase [Deltaproteobacteria bacterium]|nr:proline dehydrogenase [Deltaproteobacteria bacterium]NCP03783.1 proline dehydrogenase [Deltaproteobacteria bacterium]NCP77806.1 proline dehydrogenase [Desulfuromonadales bacterium]
MSIFNFLVSKTIMHIPGPLVHFFARGYIAGETLSDAVRVTRELNQRKMMATIDILGEFIKTKDEAIFFKQQCLEILETIHREKIDANLSLKPTQMGLELDEEFATANIREIVAKAAELGNFVRIDMEDIGCTDATIKLYRHLRAEFPANVGLVVQAYLRRTGADIENLSDAPMHFRLCKGIYNEPRTAAWKDPVTINRSFVSALKRMFRHKAYVGIATHDEKLVFEAMELIERQGLKSDEYEFQMLLGVDEELRQIIVDAGHRLRVYVPFGASWMPYSRRRLKENPAIAQHALRQMLGMKRF